MVHCSYCSVLYSVGVHCTPVVLWFIVLTVVCCSWFGHGFWSVLHVVALHWIVIYCVPCCILLNVSSLCSIVIQSVLCCICCAVLYWIVLCGLQDWVPVMEADVQRQKTQRPQGPFSDAYLQGMPPKRRRVSPPSLLASAWTFVTTDSDTDHWQLTWCTVC